MNPRPGPLPAEEQAERDVDAAIERAREEGSLPVFPPPHDPLLDGPALAGAVDDEPRPKDGP